MGKFASWMQSAGQTLNKLNHSAPPYGNSMSVPTAGHMGTVSNQDMIKHLQKNGYIVLKRNDPNIAQQIQQLYQQVTTPPPLPQ